MSPFFVLLLSLLLLPVAARGVLPDDNFTRVDLTIQARRDMQRAQYDPAAMEAAAAQKRQEIEAAMSRPPLDAPLYDHALANASRTFAPPDRASGSRAAAILSALPPTAEPETTGDAIATRVADIFIVASFIFLVYFGVNQTYRKATGAKSAL